MQGAFYQKIAPVLMLENVKKSNYPQSWILKGYFASKNGLMPFLEQTVEYAKTSGKGSVSGVVWSFLLKEKR